MLRWYLVHTKPSSEAVAEFNLSRQGYEVYLPRVVQAARRSSDCRERIVALFPRYLFLRLSEGEQALGPVRFSLGVSNVVRFGLRYAVVPDRIIQDLRSRADPLSGLHRIAAVPRPARGQQVRVEVGSFDGLEGVFEREAGPDRVVVLLNLLGQSASVCVPAASVWLKRAV